MGGGVHLHARAHQLLLSQQLPRDFTIPDTCNTYQLVVCMQGSMPAHAGADMGMPVWELGRGAMQKEYRQCGQKPAQKVA